MRRVPSGVLSVMAAGSLLLGACAEDAVGPDDLRTIAIPNNCVSAVPGNGVDECVTVDEDGEGTTDDDDGDGTN